MTTRRWLFDSVPLLALVTTCTAVGVLAATLFRPEAVLGRSVGAVLAQVGQDHEIASGESPRIADSPFFKLSRSEDPAFSNGESLVVGDRIVISGQDGVRRSLEVIDIREIDVGLSRAESASGPRFLLVSCRDTGTADQRVLRFIIEAGETTPLPVDRLQRAL